MSFHSHRFALKLDRNTIRKKISLLLYTRINNYLYLRNRRYDPPANNKTKNVCLFLLTESWSISIIISIDAKCQIIMLRWCTHKKSSLNDDFHFEILWSQLIIYTRYGVACTIAVHYIPSLYIGSTIQYAIKCI